MTKIYFNEILEENEHSNNIFIYYNENGHKIRIVLYKNR